MTTAYDALVLAGGAARRLGGADKPGVRVGGRSLLDRVLAGCRDAGTTVVVAAPRTTARPVTWAREDPPGGGPLAALDAGLRRLAEVDPRVRGALDEPADGVAYDEGARAGDASRALSTDSSTDSFDGPSAGTIDALSGAPSADPVVLVLSADLPFFGPGAAGRLLAAVGDGAGDGAVFVDGEGREQPLVAAYRVRALARAVREVRDERGGLAGLPLRLVTGRLTLARVVAEGADSFDCDTWGDIAAARARIRDHGTVLDEWITAVKDELGLDLDVDTGLLLDLARDAAHGVARPAAPLTTFLVGYAAARADGGPEAVAEAARKAAALAQRWAAEQDAAG
ncbi:DUF6457 domain-containing protein [Streptomyces sp. NPDC048659]|uniref:DUF6457 domain-containing protein n=1 Tax=Streptomyces sp. NPDC048659 TaxID=3155489 RepID=UPI003421602C